MVQYSKVVIAVLSLEREQNRNQATADITRPSPSSSATDQSRVSLPSSASLVIDTSNSFLHPQTSQGSTAATNGSISAQSGSGNNVSPSAQTRSAAELASATSADDEQLTAIGEHCSDVISDHRGKKRYATFENDIVAVIF